MYCTARVIQLFLSQVENGGSKPPSAGKKSLNDTKSKMFDLTFEQDQDLQNAKMKEEVRFDE